MGSPVNMTATTDRQRYAQNIERALQIAVGIFIVATPFAKVVASVAHSLCIILFLLHVIPARDHRWVSEARTYYRVVIAYCAIVTIGVLYSPEPMNGATEAWKQFTRLMTPIILIELVSRGQMAKKYLYAFVAGGTVLALIGIFEAFVMHAYRPPTMWHPVHGANILLLSCIGALVLAFSEKRSRPFMIFSALILLVGIYVTGTRGVWIAVLAVITSFPFILPGITVRSKWYFAAAVLFSLIVFTQTPMFRERAKEAISDIIIYRQEGKSNPFTSVAERFDMWKASYYMLLKRPVCGVGTGGWRSGLQEVIRTGQVPETLIAYGNPHNMFIEALTTRGIVGLIALCALLGYPLYLAIRHRRSAAKGPYSLLLLTSTIGFAIAGLTDTLVIIRGVFQSYLIVVGLSLTMLFRSDTSSVSERIEW